jgi:hypothetical protein
VDECKPLTGGGAGRGAHCAHARGGGGHAAAHEAAPADRPPRARTLLHQLAYTSKAVQVDPIKPTLKAPGIKLLKLTYDKPLSNFAFKFKLRRYTLAARLLEHFPNLCIGFTGIVTFKNAADVQAVVRAVPLERILLETDGPYLAPAPHRGKPAHPGHVPLIARKIAEVKGVTPQAVFAAARDNTRRIYGV